MTYLFILFKSKQALLNIPKPRSQRFLLLVCILFRSKQA